MEELKAKNIIENLESIAAEKGADALTGEIIEECCRTNDADPEDFKNFICERIDIQELKKLSSESLDQVAGGARPVKQGMASFLAATSLLGSAANFTVSAGNDALANAKRDTHKAQLIDLQKSVEYKNRRNKKKQSAWTGWDTLQYMGLGSFATCALAIAYWAHSQKNSKAPQGGTSEEEICSSVRINGEYGASNGERYALFLKLLDEHFKVEDLYDFYSEIHECSFVKTASAISSFVIQRDPWMVIKDDFSSLNKAEIKAEIGEKNIAELKRKLNDAHEYYLKLPKDYLSQLYQLGGSKRGGEEVPERSSSSSSSSSQSYQPGGSKRGGKEVSKHDGSSDGSSAVTSGVGYSQYEYYPVRVSKKYRLFIYGQSGKEEIQIDTDFNKKRLEENVNSGIARLSSMLDVSEGPIQKLGAKSFFQGQKPKKEDPRFHKMMGLSNVKDSVYKLPKGHCTVYDYGEEPIKVEVGPDTCTDKSADIWICQMYSLPALFAVDAALRQQEQKGLKGRHRLDPAVTAVQNAGNAVSPGGSILAGDGSQEESLMMDTDAYLFLNSTEAHKKYYLENKDKMGEALAKQKEDNNFPTACAVKAWTDTGIFRRGIYCKQVGLIGAKYGETINMIATAAADYNPKHDGKHGGLPETYMGPIGNYTLYEEQLIKYWDTILKIAHENKNENIVLTIGGGGAFNGKVPKIVAALRTVLREYGCDENTPWKKCFKHIIIASDSEEVKKELYDSSYDGSRCFITVSDDQKGITYEEKWFDFGETLQRTETIPNTWTFKRTQ